MTDSDKKKFGALVRKLRTERKISLRGFAKMAQLSPTLISQMERGKTRPSSEKIIEIARLLDQDPKKLLILAGAKFIPEQCVRLLKYTNDFSDADWKNLITHARKLAAKRRSCSGGKLLHSHLNKGVKYGRQQRRK